MTKLPLLIKRFNRKKHAAYNSLPVLLRGQVSTLNPEHDFIGYTTIDVRWCELSVDLNGLRFIPLVGNNTKDLTTKSMNFCKKKVKRKLKMFWDLYMLYKIQHTHASSKVDIYPKDTLTAPVGFPFNIS